MHRAKTFDGKEVFGYHCKVQGKHYMILEDAEFLKARTYGYRIDYFIDGSVDIDPKTLGMYTTVDDRHGKPIYGSFPVDGKMSEGGDIVLFDETVWAQPNTKHKIKWMGGHFAGGGILGAGDYDGSDLEIIGPACETKE